MRKGPLAISFAIASAALVGFSLTLHRAYAVGLSGSSTLVHQLFFIEGLVAACWLYSLIFLIVLRKRRAL